MEPYSMSTRIGYLILSFILFITGTVGNILIIWTILTSKPLRTTQNVLVVVLAIDDLIISGYLLPHSMDTLIHNREPDYESCRFQAVITAFLFSCSILFIMIIAISRYCKICHCRKYKQMFRIRNVIIAYFLCIIVATCFSTPLWFVENLWLFDRPIHSCIFNRYDNVVYSSVFMGLVVAVPAVVTSYCYVNIYRYVRKAHNQLYKHWNNGLARQKLTNEEMMARTQFAVFIVYLFMYFPFGITAVGGQRSNYPDALHTISIYMCYMNSCSNCLLYGILNRNMRKAYKESLLCLNHKTAATVTPIVTVSERIYPNASSTGLRTYLSRAKNENN